MIRAHIRGALRRGVLADKTAYLRIIVAAGGLVIIGHVAVIVLPFAAAVVQVFVGELSEPLIFHELFVFQRRSRALRG